MLTCKTAIVVCRAVAAAGLLVTFGCSRPLASPQPLPSTGRAPAYPFAALRPAVSPGAQTDALLAVYRSWKAAFVRQDCGPGTFQVYSPDAAYPFVAEAQGYGMVITASMARHDQQARTVFDGLLTYVLSHPSRLTADLAAAEQDQSCTDRNGGNSATDGDMDIAYGLLLADRVWGSTGRYNYHDLAVRRIAALKAATVHPTSRLMRLGDWSRPGSPDLYRTSRTSDWNPYYFGAFARATKDPGWTQIQTAHRQAVARVQADYSPVTGLLPDFVQWSTDGVEPVSGKVLESGRDGAYGFNACRTPWRIGLDAIASGDPTSTAAARKITRWFRTASGGDSAGIRSGYTLDGTPYGAPANSAFWAPLAVAAMADPQARPWLDALWAKLATDPVDRRNYYAATIRVQVMLIVTGNWTLL
jgi:endo-1,4-beta-D-glucanase Y